MKPTVYIETSIISYLTARPSRDLIVAANQAATQEWWETAHAQFEFVASLLVLDEARQGDEVAAESRLSILETMALLPPTDETDALTDALLQNLALPEKARLDASHIAIAAIHGVDFLLTWNCRHINNVFMKPRIRAVCLDAGFICPEICTPNEMLGVTR